MKKHIIAIDVGGTQVKIGVFDEAGQLLRDWQFKTDVPNLLDQLITTIARQPEYGEGLLGIGIGVPGTVDSNNRINAVNIGWEDFDLYTVLREKLNVPIAIVNDANLAALGEYHEMNLKEDMVFFTLGTGVGGGIIHEGELIRGHGGSTGEFGHMSIGYDKALCNCGRRGCLETIASATGIKRLAHKFFDDKSVETSYETAGESAKEIIDRAKAGDPLSLKVVDVATDALAQACNHITVTLNPHMIVFGGGVSQAGDFLLKRIEEAFKLRAFNPVRDTKFSLAILQNKAALYGGYWLVKNHG